MYKNIKSDLINIEIAMSKNNKGKIYILFILLINHFYKINILLENFNEKTKN